MYVELRHCAENDQYYIECELDDRTVNRKIKETRNILNKAPAIERDRLRAYLKELCRQRNYMVDYVLLEPNEVPAGVKARNMPSVPGKIVMADVKTRKWLISKLCGRESQQPVSTGRYYDLPAEGNQ